MTDIASLMVVIDTTDVRKASDDLVRFSATADVAAEAARLLARSARDAMEGFGDLRAGADRIDAAVKDTTNNISALTETAKTATTSQTGLAKSLSEAAEAQKKAAESAGLTAKDIGTLSKSFLGLAGAIATGKDPMEALIDKGSEIAAVFIEAHARGVSFKDALVSLGEQYGLLRKVGGAQAADVLKNAGAFEAMAAKATEAALAQGELSAAVMAGASSAAPEAVAGAAAVSAANEGIAATATEAAAAEAVALAPLALIAAGIALVVGTVATGFSLAAFEMNRHTQGLNENLGLTKEQLDRVKDKSITAGDVMHGVWNLAADALKKAFGPALSDLKEKFGQWLDDTINGAVTGASALAATFVAAFDAVKSVWGMLPAAFGDLIIQTVNHILGGFNKVLQFILPKLNPLIDMANRISAATGHPLNIKPFDITADFIKPLDNPFAGAWDQAQKKLQDTFTVSFSKHFTEFRNSIISAADAAIAAIVKAHNERVVKEAGEPPPKPPAVPKPAAITKAAGPVSNPEALSNQAAAIDAIGDAARNAMPKVANLSAAVAGVGKDLANTGNALAKTDAPLDQTTQKLVALGQQGQAAAKGLAKSFGDVGKALGDMLNLYNDYAVKQAQFDKRRQDAAGDDAKLAQVNKEAAEAQTEYYLDVAKAAEGMVDKKSNAYQALMAAEKLYRAFQFAMAVRAALTAQWEAAQTIAAGQQQLVADTAQTATLATNNAVKASTGAAAGAGNMFSQLGVAAFPFVAAMIAVMASLGSGQSGGAVPGAQDAEKRQKAQGAGSVLGDASAKSESIKRSLDLVADHTNNMLEFYNPMLSALRSIDSQIGTVAEALARSLGVGGMLDTSTLGLGTSFKKGGLVTTLASGLISQLLPGLFGTKVTRTLQDQGLQFSADTLAAILSGGLQGKTYAQIAEERKSSFFGLTYSDKTSRKTVLGALDPEFARQTTLLIGSLRDGVVAAASTLGIEGAAATLDAFKLNLGKISLKDLKGEEITQALEAVFGKAADQMAAAVMPGLAQFQKVGEGAFETLTRLARDYQVVDVTLKSIGKVFGTVGLASVEARERLIELSGGLDDFTSQASFYAENFLTEAERLAPIQNAVTAELARLGLTGVKTRDQFKAVVQGLDVSTEAGAQLYAALMTLAPAFAAVTQESQALSDAKDALSGAYERESGALQDTHDRFADLARSLHDFGAGLYSGPAAALSPEAQYRAAQAAFQQTAGQAAQGNEQALGDLQNVSQAYLDASKAYYASSAGYFADLAAVREAVSAAEASAGSQADVAQQQLDAMTEQVGQLIELNTHVVTVAEAIATLNLLLGGGGHRPVVDPVMTKSSSASNDNAVVTAIQDLQTEVAGVSDQLAADKTQRAAIARQQDERLAALEEQLAAMRRAAQA